jgi:hypothetical protein
LRKLEFREELKVPCPENDETTGEVTGFSNSPEGEIAFVETEDYGPVTVLLNANHWHGVGAPLKGEMLVISGLTKFRKGWRAMLARRFTLADEKIAN